MLLRQLQTLSSDYHIGSFKPDPIKDIRGLQKAKMNLGGMNYSLYMKNIIPFLESLQKSLRLRENQITLATAEVNSTGEKAAA